MKLPADIVSQWIPKGARVLDLGCGDGTLLEQLQQERHVSGYGVEIGAAQITACVAKGINVIEKNLDTDLPSFQDNSFDTVIMTQTLQAVHYPDKVIDEMLRIGNECIVTFPNFGYWKARTGLALGGKMPVSKELPYSWYDTPNIHFCTIRDFENLCRSKGITILAKHFMNNRLESDILCSLLPNLFALTAIYRISR